MTSTPRLSARMRALNEAAEIAEERARSQRNIADLYGHTSYLGTTAREADHIASMIRERMQRRMR